MRERILKVIDTGKNRHMIFVAQALRGVLGVWTVIPTTGANYMNRQ
ncbi:MAG: hypothetical protein SWH61_01895 [Thermodesulfobacteriota bacterium]|nr:hypothetical protein [Thermodesulfobacteriota bacterium]